MSASLLTTEGLWRALTRRDRLFLIAGPCVIESPTHPHRVAARVKAVTDGLVRLFGPPTPWLSSLRNAGLAAVDRLPLLKRALTQPALR